MNKVKLPKEVAEAVERKRGEKTEHGMPPWTMKDYADAYMNGIGATQVSLRKVPFETLMSALVNGYEVEETPEDKVREYYNVTKDRSVREPVLSIRECFDFELLGITTTLAKLGIQIEGVNT